VPRVAGRWRLRRGCWPRGGAESCAPGRGATLDQAAPLPRRAAGPGAPEAAPGAAGHRPPGARAGPLGTAAPAAERVGTAHAVGVDWPDGGSPSLGGGNRARRDVSFEPLFGLTPLSGVNPRFRRLGPCCCAGFHRQLGGRRAPCLEGVTGGGVRAGPEGAPTRAGARIRNPAEDGRDCPRRTAATAPWANGRDCPSRGRPRLPPGRTAATAPRAVGRGPPRLSAVSTPSLSRRGADRTTP